MCMIVHTVFHIDVSFWVNIFNVNMIVLFVFITSEWRDCDKKNQIMKF